jgi:hypothetical protein
MIRLVTFQQNQLKTSGTLNRTCLGCRSTQKYHFGYFTPLLSKRINNGQLCVNERILKLFFTSSMLEAKYILISYNFLI